MDIKITQVAPDAFDVLMTGEGARRLRVGSVVCDCRYRHLKISKISPECFPFAPSEIYDLLLEFEDGSQCGLLTCCNFVPHDDWEHPSPEEVKQLMDKFNGSA